MAQQISMFETLDLEIENTEKVNLADLTDDELIALREKIEEEVLARKLAKSAVVQRGEYLVGRDIPAGAYRVAGNVTGTTFIVHDKRSRLRYNMVCYKKEGIGKVTLNDGDVLWIDEPIRLIVYTGQAGVFE